MKTIYLSTFLIILWVSVQAQTDSLAVRIAGIVFSEDSAQQTPYVHVINLRTGRGVISDSVGIFKLKSMRKDTLRFSCIGFSDYHYIIPDSIETNRCLLSIKMSPTSYNLNVVDVLSLSRKSQIKYDLINMHPPEKTWRDQEIIPGITRGEYQLIRPNEQPLGFNTFSPISSVYNAFSKAEKQKQKLAALLKQDKLDEIIDNKFNREKLFDFTKYHESKLDCFTMYLGFKSDYLLYESEYEIYIKIKQKMIPFEFNYLHDSLTMLNLIGK